MVCVGTRARTAYGFKLAMLAFGKRYFGSLYFWTFTFSENVEDLGEARRRYGAVEDLFRRLGVEWIGAWERQQRGAWHLHVLVNRRLDVEQIRPFLVEHGWGPQMRAEYVKGQADDARPGFRDKRKGVKQVVVYLVKYVTKGTAILCAGKRSLVVCSRRWRNWSTQFKWSGGLSRIYRIGMELWMATHTQLPKWNEVDAVMALGWEGARTDPALYREYFMDPDFEPF